MAGLALMEGETTSHPSYEAEPCQRCRPPRREILIKSGGFEGMDEYRCHIDIPRTVDQYVRAESGYIPFSCWEGLGT